MNIINRILVFIMIILAFSCIYLGFRSYAEMSESVKVSRDEANAWKWENLADLKDLRVSWPYFSVRGKYRVTPNDVEMIFEMRFSGPPTGVPAPWFDNVPQAIIDEKLFVELPDFVSREFDLDFADIEAIGRGILSSAATPGIPVAVLAGKSDRGRITLRMCIETISRESLFSNCIDLTPMILSDWNKNPVKGMQFVSKQFIETGYKTRFVASVSYPRKIRSN